MKRLCCCLICFLLVIADLGSFGRFGPQVCAAASGDAWEDSAITAEAVSASSIKVRWTADEEFYGVFFIRRKASHEDAYYIVGGVLADGRKNYTYTDQNVRSNVEYEYEVDALEESGVEDVCASEHNSI